MIEWSAVSCSLRSSVRNAATLARLGVLLWAVSLSPGFARTVNLNPALTALCYQAISRASAQMGVPRDVMLAISLTETGKKIGGKVQPWPWTVNMEGAGVWFETPGEALAYVNARYATGSRSFDVGCFQINYRWHHQHFRSIEDMFDPDINALYAAKFLRQLYDETGSWAKAAGFYHSRTPEFAQRYSKRFAGYLARLSGGDAAPVFEGHGSEALTLAQADDVPAARPAPQWPLAKLGQAPAPVFMEGNPGSLVLLDGRAGGLLTAANRPLF